MAYYIYNVWTLRKYLTSLLVTIQLLQLLQYNPDPMSVSNIGDSPVSQVVLITSSTWEYLWPQQPSVVGSLRESDIFVLVSLKCLSLRWRGAFTGSFRRSSSWQTPWLSRGTGRTPRRPSGRRTSRRRPCTRRAAPWSRRACSGPQGIAPSWKKSGMWKRAKN